MKLLVKDLKEGMIFSAPVFIEEDKLFSPPKEPLKRKDIDRLILLGIESVETEGKLLPPPAGTANPPPLKPAQGALPGIQEISIALGIYTEIIGQINEVCTNIAQGLSVNSHYIDTISRRLLQNIRDQGKIYMGFILGEEIKGKRTAKSLVNTAVLSALTALEMKLNPQEVLAIVIAALLHDAGMLRIPKEIVEKRGSLSAAELQRIQSHPVLTYRIITHEFKYSEAIGLIALQHHERWDGEGYPQRLSGPSISLGARIISVADAFEAMVSHKPYRNSLMGYQAMKNLLSDNMRRFDPDVIKAFIETMGIYPIGSLVSLNNGILGRVVEVQSQTALRPRIQILVDQDGKKYAEGQGALLDLRSEKSLYISKAVDPRDR
ncbi:MAG: HD-GYP domain-containing protein [Treponema sp.]|nr:HD-GYP domain-containing protein [Treponema sp.]